MITVEFVVTFHTPNNTESIGGEGNQKKTRKIADK